MTVALETCQRFVPVCRLDEIPLGLGRAFRIGEHVVALFRSRSGSVFAMDNRCPHKGAPLTDGMLAGDQVVCPYHAFRFDTRSGECDQNGVCGVGTYPVKVIDGTVQVALPVSGGTSPPPLARHS